MLSALFTFTNTLLFIDASLLIILFADKIINNFSEIKTKILTSEITINVALKLINIYSKLQILYAQTIQTITYFINNNPKLKTIVCYIFNNTKNNTKTCDVIQFQKVGIIHIKTCKQNVETYFENLPNSIYIYYDYNSETGKGYEIVLQSQPFRFDYEISNIKFLLVELNVGDKKFKINLNDELNNYYVVSNVFDKIFFLYYLFSTSHMYSERIIYDEIKTMIDTATVTVIDNNANIVNVDFLRNGSITILKDDYIINHSES
jgi:hypothetical protein